MPWQQPTGRTARQTNLFDGDGGPSGQPRQPEPLALAARQLQQWRRDLGRFQAPLFMEAVGNDAQGELFSSPTDTDTSAVNPLTLRSQALSFWRWPQPPQQGAAIYFVLDAAVSEPEHPALLLYVGETGQADRRWKGEHDCKHYLSAYSEALVGAGLDSRLSIRFWLDVPVDVRRRRAQEQALIRRWLPPFNKETRQRWATPFTADCG
jgi:hypothetical protein